jgi:hypothetical protein
MVLSGTTPPTATVTLIHQFGATTNDGEYPNGALCQDTVGNFYGTTSGGGAHSSGTMFSIITTQSPSHPPVFTGPTSVSSPALTPLSFTAKANFGVSSNGAGVALVQPGFAPQLVGRNFSSTTNWEISPATLPEFLDFNSTTGTLTGTPIQPGTYTLTLTPENANGMGTPQTVTLYIDVAPSITSKATDTGVAGTAYSYQITGTASPVSYGATGLPGWLSVNTETGLISGTPPGGGTYTFSPTATNVSGTGTELVTLTVSNNSSSAPVLTSATTASGTVGSSFSYQITATNSPTSYSALSLPAGLVFNSTTGTITGTPSTVGTYPVPISATNASGSSSAVLTLTVSPIIAPVITSPTMLSCTPANSVSYQITGTNAPTSFSASGLPTGLNYDSSSGIISGTPATTGTSMVTLSATNTVGTGTATLALVVQQSGAVLPVVTSSSQSSTATLTFSYQVSATNNPNSFAATGLPTGLSIDPNTGIISGSPTQSGTFNVTLYATNPTLGTGSAALTLTVADPTFSQWATLHPSVTSPTATPMNDGVPNLMKYFSDIQPDAPMTLTDREKLPFMDMVEYEGSDYLALTYREYQFATGVTPVVETSTDLQTWTPVELTSNYFETMTPADDGSGDMMMEVGVKAPTSGRQFLRLILTSP